MNIHIVAGYSVVGNLIRHRFGKSVHGASGEQEKKIVPCIPFCYQDIYDSSPATLNHERQVSMNDSKRGYKVLFNGDRPVIEGHVLERKASSFEGRDIHEDIKTFSF
jgi:hypothetical protein